MFAVKLVRRGLLGLALAAGTTAAAPAAKACDYEPVYRRVVVLETRVVPVIRYVTRYDHCGDAYTIAVKAHKTVAVPVAKYVRVY